MAKRIDIGTRLRSFEQTENAKQNWVKVTESPIETLNRKTEALQKTVALIQNEHLHNAIAQSTIDRHAYLQDTAANAVKRYAGHDGFNTVIYGLGGPDFRGSEAFLGKDGGHIWAIGEEPVTNFDKTQYPKSLGQQDLWESKLHTALDQQIRDGFLQSEDDTILYYQQRQTLAFMANLAAAGVNPGNMQVTSEYRIQYGPKDVSITTIAIQYGTKQIEFHSVSGISFPMASQFFGPGLELIQEVMNMANALHKGKPDKLVTISKASHNIGVLRLAQFLHNGNIIALAPHSGLNTHEEQGIQDSGTPLNGLRELSDLVDPGYQRAPNDATYGYTLNVRDILVAKIGPGKASRRKI